MADVTFGKRIEGKGTGEKRKRGKVHQSDSNLEHIVAEDEIDEAVPGAGDAGFGFAEEGPGTVFESWHGCLFFFYYF